MRERFTSTARAVVVAAECEARDLDSTQIGTEHLLLGLTTVEGAARAVLADSGVTEDGVRRELLAWMTPRGRFSPEETAALRELGIDLDVVLGRLEESLGADVLVPSRARPRRVRFSRNAGTALRLALREAVRRSSRTIGSEHLLLGVLDAADPELRAVLAALGTTTEALRTTTLRTIDAAA